MKIYANSWLESDKKPNFYTVELNVNFGTLSERHRYTTKREAMACAREIKTRRDLAHELITVWYVPQSGQDKCIWTSR